MQSPDSQPLVSMTIFCYNQEKFIVECLEGVRAQTYKHTDLIIMDDASTDGSVAVIREWIRRHDVECQFIAHEQNQGVSNTINEAYSLARGKYISPCSGDDVWLSDKIERQVPIMESLPEDYGLLYSDAVRIDESGKLLLPNFIAKHRRFDEIPQGDLRAQLLEGNFIPGMTMLVRREAQQRVGLYDSSLGYEDWDMMIRFAQQFKFSYSPHISVKYREVSTSLTNQFVRTHNPAHLLTNFTLYRRSLGYDWIDKNQRARLLVLSRAIAEELYRSGVPGSADALRKTLRDQFSLRMFVLYLLSLFRIPATTPAALMQTLRRAIVVPRRRAQPKTASAETRDSDAATNL
ncbi:MAG TPA: glycosyltransferase [Pyrinomonadaceae bacterium]|jgi:glycosyltransferase involved in cell wall biosynthesis|nr:glycosyltransferase [Pyrinomonadaceae bacterium]